MVVPPTDDLIPFHPLLKQITECLNFPDPMYQYLDVSKNNACVVVKTDCGPIAYMYVGGETQKLEESCENAARKAVRDLIRKYDVYVEDVTSMKREMFGRCSGLYKLKRIEFERVEKGESKIPMHEDLFEDVQSTFKQVSVDFMAILRAVFRKANIPSTPIETIEHSPTQYTSWFTVTSLNSSLGFQCIFSDYSPTLASAKQSLAKRALDYLILIYNLDIVDANYNPSTTKFDAILCTLERESYLTVKERVLGIKEDIQPSLLLVEQDCLTPRGAAYQIPSIISSPLPPKKRKSRAAAPGPSIIAASELNLPPYFSVPDELETVFKRT